MKKERAKILGIILFGLILISALMILVNAQASPSDIGKATWSGFKEGLKEVIGDNVWLTRILMAVLVFMIVYNIVATIFGSSNWTTWAITLVITVLGFIALPAEFLHGILISYGAMAAAILSIIPFLIILVFTIRIRSMLAGRILWIFFCVYYFAIAIYRWSEAGYWTTESIVYGAAMIAGVAIFFLLGSIRKALFKGEMKGLEESGRQVADRAKLLHKLQTTELKGSYGSDTAGN